MKRSITKILSLFLAAMLILSLLSACKGGNEGKETTAAAKTSSKVSSTASKTASKTSAKGSASGSSTAARTDEHDPEEGGPTNEDPTNEDPEDPTDPGEPTDEGKINTIDIDMQGYTLTYIARQSSSEGMFDWDYTDEEYEFTRDEAIAYTMAKEEETGMPYEEIYNLQTDRWSDDYAGQRLMRDAMKKYNFDVTCISGGTDHKDVAQMVIASHMANTYLADVMFCNTSAFIPSVVDMGALVAWEDVGFDFDNDPRLNSNVFLLTSGKWRGKHYGFAKPNTAEIALYYNLDLFDQLNLPDLHQFVYEGTWNWNTFADIARQGTVDFNSDGIIDVYGAIGDKPQQICDAFALSNGVVPIGYDESTDRVTFNLNTQAGVRALQFVSQLVNTDKVLFAPEKDGKDMFDEGYACMLVGFPSSSAQRIQGNFGWAPVPLGVDNDVYIPIRQNIDMQTAIAGTPYAHVLPHIIVESNVTWDTTREVWDRTPEELVSNLYRVGSKIHRQEDADLCTIYLGAPFMTFANSFSSTKKLVENNIYKRIVNLETTPRSALDEFSSMIQADLDEAAGQ